MKKKTRFILLCLLLITGCKSSIEPSHKEKKTHNLSYYKEKLKFRYEEYQQKNTVLKEEDIITRVNIGIDQPPYTNTIETKFPNRDDVFVNKYHYLKSSYTPQLEKISPTCSNNTRLLSPNAKKAFEKLCIDAKADGLTIRAMSAYRSYQYQETLYQNYVKKDGIEKADTYSARPGFSEHQTGLVVDVDNEKENYANFEKTKEFEWMQKNASNYGFILRYPKEKEEITGYSYESWHYRYVGVEIAKAIKKLNLTFDEYYIRYLDK